MVSSLKRTYSESLNLYIGSKDFLRVFTDATNHIPRHRRTRCVAALLTTEAEIEQDLVSSLTLLTFLVLMISCRQFVCSLSKKSQIAL